MDFQATIKEIINSIKQKEFSNEAEVTNGIVLRILNELHWDVFDINRVKPQYRVANQPADFALCFPDNKPVIIIEIKRHGNAANADEQVLKYAFNTGGVPIVILTDGQEWHFYLPAERGSLTERRFYKLDLLEREPSEIVVCITNYMYICNQINKTYMETIETGLDPSQSLQLISETINKTRENIKEHSFCFMLWGWLIATASFSFYILHSYTDFRLYFLPFPVLVGIGIIVTIAYYTRRKNSSETYLGHYLKMLWIVLGFSFILAVFINIVQHHTPFTYMLLIGGIGTLASGLALRFRPLVIGGVLFLLSFVLSAFIAEEYKPLIQGIAVVAGYLIPGYLLKSSKA